MATVPPHPGHSRFATSGSRRHSSAAIAPAAVEQRGDRSEQGQDGADPEPDPEAVAAHLGHDACGQPGEEDQDDVRHGLIVAAGDRTPLGQSTLRAQTTAAMASTTTTIQKTAATTPTATLKRIHAAST